MNTHPEPLPLPAAPSRLPRPRAGLLIAVLLLSFVLGLAWLVAGQLQSESSRAALEDLRARSTRLHHLDTLLLQMLDAESSVRGYLLTHNTVYLTPYQDGQAELERTLAALKEADTRPATQAGRAFARAVYGNLPSLIAARARYPEVRAPVHLIYGETDWSRPSDRQANQQLLPAAEFVQVPGAGHFIVLERPDVAAKVLNDVA